MHDRSQLPDAFDVLDTLGADGLPLSIFLDYDGTLSPIVERPEDAVLAPEMKEILERHGLREGANSEPAEYVVEKAFVGDGV